jgi:hypothetical protein
MVPLLFSEAELQSQESLRWTNKQSVQLRQRRDTWEDKKAYWKEFKRVHTARRVFRRGELYILGSWAGAPSQLGIGVGIYRFWLASISAHSLSTHSTHHHFTTRHL